ncbi:MAG TPA: biotin-dependent carboxyltransferase family protein [Methylovirgula sp.]|nr:biotin-dependent carboxyltransferase family protein [Methylovirgula sp.]
MSLLRVLRAGIGATVQDAGRRHYRRYGVTPAGPMDWGAFETANFALGNDPERAAAIEVGPGGIEISCEATGAIGVAFCGGGFFWQRDGADLGSAARIFLRPGERLAARPGSGSFAYLAVAGGLNTPVELGSRATHTRSRMGGIEGRMLRDGDVLALLAEVAPLAEGEISVPWLERDSSPLRVVPGPQDDYFTPAALETFFSAEFRLTPTADRMAYRLDGPEIAHKSTYNIVSDGIAMGAIQISGDRKPLVLMADHPPTGGYPKLGHVARVDIGRLAQLRRGEPCRFVRASLEEARSALVDRQGQIATTARHLRRLR